MSRPIVFVDTETTALGRRARPWEIAVIRRESGRNTVREWVEESEHVLHVLYDFPTLPEGTSPKALKVGGWLERGAAGSTYLLDLPPGPHGEVEVYCDESERRVAQRLARLLADEPILVGVGVHFDAAVLSSMFLRHGLPEEPWHYAIVDLKAATWGFLKSCTSGGIVDDLTRRALQIPLSSELLAATLKVEPPDDDERHTALGDARWARRWFDALAGDER